MLLLTTNELSKVLKVSETTIYRWARSNRIPFIRMNGRFRFSHEDIDQFLQGNKDIIIKRKKKDSENLVN